MPETCLRDLRTIDVADADERLAVERDAQLAQGADRARHQPFAARLVQDAVASLTHLDVEAGTDGVQRGRQADRGRRRRPRGHASLPTEVVGRMDRAAASTRIRTVRSAALRTVKPTAVIQQA